MSEGGFVASAKGFWRTSSARAVLANTGWLLAERALTLLLALTTHVWLARYLGAAGFGALSYAIAFVGLFGSFTYLGFSSIITRDLVSNPSQQNELLGTTFVLKLGGAFVAIVIANLLALWQVDDGPTRALIQIQSFALLADGFSVITFWYHARVEARYAVIASATGSIGSAALKIALILCEKPLLWFGVATAAQGLITSVTLCSIYLAHGYSILAWRARASRAWELLSQSWPLALSSVVAMIYLKIDQVMLGYLTDESTVGIYSVAARLSEIWYVVPTTVATSLFPSIVKGRLLPAEQQMARMRKLYRYMFLLAVTIALPVTFGAAPLVRLLYGEQYAAAGPILAVHIWACPAMFMGAVLAKWLIAEGLLRFSMTRDVIGALLNVVLNLLLIPKLAGMGAAIATVISYTVASYLCCFTNRHTMQTGQLMTEAILYPLLFLIPQSRHRLR